MVREQDWRQMVPQWSWVRILLAALRFATLAIPFSRLCLSFGGDTKSGLLFLSSVDARESKISHTDTGGYGGTCVICHGLHNSEINHSCVSLSI